MGIIIIIQFMPFYSSDDTAVDSTQDQQTRENKQTFPAESSSIATGAESTVSSQEKEADQVGSSNNGVSTAIKHENAEMIPESSSEAQEKVVTNAVVSSMEVESSSVASAEPSLQVKFSRHLGCVRLTIFRNRNTWNRI